MQNEYQYYKIIGGYMQAKININGIEAIIGYTGLESVCQSLDDCEKNSDILHELANSNYYEIRRMVAYYDYLKPETLKILLKDTSIDVLREIVTNEKAIKYIQKDDIERFIKKGDPELLTSIASDVNKYAEKYGTCDVNWLCEKLSNQKDPSVRAALADNTDIPMFILIKLSEDEDVEVANKAKESIYYLQT
jgi:hypothetical protein